MSRYATITHMGKTTAERQRDYRARQRLMTGAIKKQVKTPGLNPELEALAASPDVIQTAQQIAQEWQKAYGAALRTLHKAAKEGNVQAAATILQYCKAKPVIQVDVNTTTTSSLDATRYSTEELRLISELYRRQDSTVDSTCTPVLHP